MKEDILRLRAPGRASEAALKLRVEMKPVDVRERGHHDDVLITGL